MILLSLNLRGVEGSHKLASVRHLFHQYHSEILFFQENLVDELLARSFLHSLKPEWYSAAISSDGRSGGLLVAWDTKKFDLRHFVCCGGLLCNGYSFELKLQLSFLNIYGSCTNRKEFWQKVKDHGLLFY